MALLVLPCAGDFCECAPLEFSCTKGVITSKFKAEENRSVLPRLKLLSPGGYCYAWVSWLCWSNGPKPLVSLFAIFCTKVKKSSTTA